MVRGKEAKKPGFVSYRTEELVKDARAILERLKGEGRLNLYFHPDEDHGYFFSRAKEYWEKHKPSYAAYLLGLTNPALLGAYQLWELPEDLHRHLNTALEYATFALTRVQPEAAVATGIAYALSEVIYAVKIRSGKRLLSGLVGLLTHLKKVPHAEKAATKTLKNLEDRVGERL